VKFACYFVMSFPRWERGGGYYREVENIHRGDDPISVGVKRGEFKQVSISVLIVCLTSTVVFITVVESVYSAVRTDSLYKADYVSSSKG
jgi:hypothetical protein